MVGELVREARLIRVTLDKDTHKLAQLEFDPRNVGGAAIPVYVDLIMARDRLQEGHPIYILLIDFVRLQALL